MSILDNFYFTDAIVGGVVGIIIALLFITIIATCIWKNSNSISDELSAQLLLSNVKDNRVSHQPPAQPVDTSVSAPVPSLPQQNQTSSKPILLSDFEMHFEMMKENFNDEFEKEFDELELVGRDASTSIASNPSNKPRNRYKNILPYDKNLVVLSTSNEFPNSYINASFITDDEKANHLQNSYIATQAPLEKTVDDFWRMIWEQNCKNIIMLTDIFEYGKKKCEMYWPTSKENEISFGGMKIVLDLERKEHECMLRELTIYKNEEYRRIRHFHYISWPDHGVPETSESLITFVKFVRSQSEQEINCGPTAIHCSAGVGRTGTFIAADFILQRSETNPSSIDIFGLVYKLRLQRMSMVQTENQYIFLYKLVLELLDQRRKVNRRKNDHHYENVPIYQNIPLKVPTEKNTDNQIKIS